DRPGCRTGLSGVHRLPEVDGSDDPDLVETSRPGQVARSRSGGVASNCLSTCVHLDWHRPVPHDQSRDTLMLRLLPGLFYTADAMTRAEMARGEFFDERTYVATLLSRSRDLWRLAGGSCAF